MSLDTSDATAHDPILPDAHSHDAETERLAPGLPAHVLRLTDVDPKAARQAERQVATMFLLSALLTVAAIVAYVVTDPNQYQFVPLIGDVSSNNLWVGTLIGLSLFLIGIGAIQWAKKLMPDDEVVAERHPLSSTQEDIDGALAVLRDGAEASGIVKRPLIRRSLLTAMAVLPLPTVVLLRDLGPLPQDSLRHTMFADATPQKPIRIVNDVTGSPIKIEDVQVGTLVNAIPETLQVLESKDQLERFGRDKVVPLNERGKAAVILVRIDSASVKSVQGKGWDVDGIFCFSKICTHVGCPTSLYEQNTHHLLCPCHQSTFDLSDSGKVIFGPAHRAMPQLAITTNAEGYLVATGDFTQPVGPSFFER